MAGGGAASIQGAVRGALKSQLGEQRGKEVCLYSSAGLWLRPRVSWLSPLEKRGLAVLGPVSSACLGQSALARSLALPGVSGHPL